MDSKTFTRGAGVLLSITSLPSDYGLGTLGEAAYNFVDLLVDMRQKYWLMQPLNLEGFRDNPYWSYSAFAGNPCLIDLNDLVKEGLLRREELQDYSWGGEKEDFDYAVFFKNRYQILQKAYERFDRTEKPFLRFCESNKEWLADYAFFIAVKVYSGNREWFCWEPGLKNREPAAMKKYEVILEEQILFWKFCQYKFYTQWSRLKKYANSRGIRLIGDIPLYIPLDSVDIWAHRDEFVLNKEGTPDILTGRLPDDYSNNEDSWGLPVYDWERMEKKSFSWWKRRMRMCAVLYDIIHIDSFFCTVRYYSVAAGGNGQGGKWNKGPGKKLADAIEEAIGSGRIMAEENDTSTPGIRKLKARTGWPGMKSLVLAFDGNTANENLPHNYTDTNLMVYVGTHSNDTILNHYKNKSEYELSFLYEYLGIRSREEITDAFIRLAYSSVADVVIVQMQDILTGNDPGREVSGMNWRWRFRRDGLTEERRSWLRTLAVIYRR